MIILTVLPIDLDKRKFKLPWKSFKKIGKGIGSIFGGGDDDDDNGAYPMYKREENEEGQ